MRSVEFEEKLAYTLLAYQAAMKLPPRFTNLPRGPRATVMLRCSQEESRRIRTAAASGVHGAFQMLIIGAVPLSAEMFAKSSMSGCRRKFLPRIFSVSRCSICSAFLNPWGISPAGTHESRRRRVRTVHLVIPFTKGAAVLPRRALHRDLLLHTVPIFPPNRSLEGWNAHAQESRDMLTAYFLITCPVVPT